jgi:hypothetical protein
MLLGAAAHPPNELVLKPRGDETARPHRTLRSWVRENPSSESREGSQQWPIPPAELRRRQAKALYETEMFFREEGLSDFVYDEENDLFRFEDGWFAFSRTHVDVKLLEERGYSA